MLAQIELTGDTAEEGESISRRDLLRARRAKDELTSTM